MIGYFPPLYDDELLYSWFARYHENTRNISPKRTLNDIFHSTNIVAVVDLPSNINKVYEVLKHFNVPEVETLIQNHTLYKYYTFFQSEKMREKVMNNIKFSGKPGSSHLLLGINASNINDWKYIRFCPSCCQEDIKKCGEPYWHVSHQLPKSFYCIKHNELLFDSLNEARNKHKHRYISANSNVEIRQTTKPSYSSKTEQHLMMIAKENNKLLELNYRNVSLNIQEIYKYLLQINGYANYSGKMDQQKLTEQFIKFYGVELLELLDSDVDISNPSCWLKAITRKHRKAFHPIRHILLLNFLGVAVEDLKDLTGKKYYPFGEAPYYCLNHAADHYKEKVVKEVTITSCTETRKPVGTFKCKCGFTYSRRGPDIYIGDEFKVGRIKDFGVVWIQKLNKLINSDLNYKDVAKILNCDPATVIKYSDIKDRKEDIAPNFNENSSVKELKEKEWLELINENPLLTLTSIRNINPSLYTWHYRNNKEFLKKNSPRNKSKLNPRSRVNWEIRDSETLNQVTEVIENLFRMEKPIFVNKTNISKRISNPSFVEKHIEKLPKTKDYLMNNIESREAFQVRRIFWSCKVLRENGEVLRIWKVRRLAGLKKTMDNKIESILENEEVWGEQL